MDDRTQPIHTAVVEEHDGIDALGLELEDEPDAQSLSWEPDDIRVNTKSFSLRHVLDLIEDGGLELAPDFQRERVWKPMQRSRLIESILLGIPIGAFYFAEDADGVMRVVDGLQRLSAVFDYARDQSFTLRDLEYLTGEQGKHYTDLDAPWQRRIGNFQIVAHVIDPVTPDEVKYDIFKRINTGGTPLNGQEIRHCMSRARSRAFLRRCAGAEELHAATAGTLRNHRRMMDREMALRFCAFRLLGGWKAYHRYRSMESFLGEATRQLDDPSRVPDERLNELYGEFQRAMRHAHQVFGQQAFRKPPADPEQGRWNPINRALFETWSVVLVDIEPGRLARCGRAVAEGATNAMKDPDFVDAITSSTGTTNRVETRFRVVEQIVERACP